MKAYSLAALCFLVLSAFAQKVDFSGSWNFTKQESISGKLYSNGSPMQINIMQSIALLSIDKINTGANNANVTISEKLTTEGKPVESITASKKKKTITTTWAADGKSFIRFTTISGQEDVSKLERKVTDSYSIVDGTLVLQRKDENLVNGEVWESKAYYVK